MKKTIYTRALGAATPICLRTALSGSIVLMSCGGALAQDTESRSRLPKGLSPIFEAKLRYEHVDQENFDLDANALTLGLRYGLDYVPLDGLKFRVLGDSIFRLAGDFNDLSGRDLDRPVVADRENTELDELNVQYSGLDGLVLLVGRESFAVGNQRWIGSVPWRQSQQTFDLARAVYAFNDRIQVQYAYINQVNRVFGDADPIRGRFHGDSHMIEAVWRPVDGVKLTGFGYWNDINENPLLSTRTLSVSVDATYPINDRITASVYAEYASQSDYEANPDNYSVDYVHLVASAKAGRLSGSVGWELLGSNGINRVTAPSSTLFKFNGFADVFLVTPTEGLQDLYLTAAYKFGDAGPFKHIQANAWLHDFKSDAGSLDFGEEVDLRLSSKVGPIGLSLWLSDYGGSPVRPDVTKVFLQATYSF